MSKIRFLRDDIIGDLKNDVDQILKTLKESGLNQGEAIYGFDPCTVMFQTFRLVLERQEEVLDNIRAGATTDELIAPLVDAAMHIQTSLRSVHGSMIQKIETNRTQMTDLLQELGIEDSPNEDDKSQDFQFEV